MRRSPVTRDPARHRPCMAQSLGSGRQAARGLCRCAARIVRHPAKVARVVRCSAYTAISTTTRETTVQRGRERVTILTAHSATKSKSMATEIIPPQEGPRRRPPRAAPLPRTLLNDRDRPAGQVLCGRASKTVPLRIPSACSATPARGARNYAYLRGCHNAEVWRAIRSSCTDFSKALAANTRSRSLSSAAFLWSRHRPRATAPLCRGVFETVPFDGFA